MNRVRLTGVMFGLLFLANFAEGSDKISLDTKSSDAKSSESKPEDDQSVLEAKVFSERATVEATLWKLTLEDDTRTVATDKEPVLNWSWSDNGRYYGNVHVYSAYGRPVAIVKFFEWFSPIEGVFFQCTSLSDIPMTATRDGQAIWTPTSSNVTMQDVPDAPAPAKTAPARLFQMRRMAESFDAEVDDKLGVDSALIVRRLRLMPRPIFRYGNAEGEVLDGALFAYAINADAAVVLMLEAVRSNEKVRWRFGFPREWSSSARASYQGKLVWEIQEINPRLDPKANFYLNELPQTVK